MLIVLKDLPHGPTPLAFDVPIDPEELDLDGAARFEGLVHVADRVELRGRISGRLRLECGRCLDAFVLPRSLEVELRIVNEQPESAPSEAEMQPEDASLIYSSEGRIDLAEVVRELLALEVPLKPVCVAECRGLCPACGENRNRIECGCATDAIDLRLAPLLDLRRSGK